MAGEQLQTAAQVIASFPDNTQQLISPLDMRNYVISAYNDTGLIVDEGPFTVPITDGVFTSLNAEMPSPAFFGNFWKTPGAPAWQLQYAYTDEGVIVNPATNRLAEIRWSLRCSKTTQGNSTYRVAIFFDGVQQGDGATFTLTTQIESTIQLTGLRSIDVSTAPLIDARIAGVGTGDDITVTYYGLDVIGTIL